MSSITSFPTRVALLAFAFTPLRADEAWLSRESSPRGTFVFSLDNDLFNGSDDKYTSGVQVSWISGYLDSFREAPGATWLGSGFRRLPFLDTPGRQHFVSYSLSHRMFTPHDITRADPIETDLPYSAALLGAATATAQDATRLDAWTFTSGVVGPSALGEQAQKTIHRFTGSPQPRGWSHQLHDEPIFNIAYENRVRLVRFGNSHNWNGDIISQAGATAGNLITMGTLGAGFRFGKRVPDDFGIPPQSFSEETIGARSYSRRRDPHGYWFFLHANTSVFARAIFWDGNTFRDSPSISHGSRMTRVYSGMHLQDGAVGAGFAVTATTMPARNAGEASWQLYSRFSVSYTY